MRRQVVIIGGGPAGSLLSHLLHLEGVDSLVLERRDRAYVLSRIRAGVLEQASRDLLLQAGLGQRLEREGFVHDGVELAFGGERLRVDFQALTGRSVTIYGQTEIQHDLYEALDRREDAIVFEADDVALHDIETSAPYVTYEVHGVTERVDCDWIVGCDGQHGVSRTAVPAGRGRSFERVYPFGWLGVLSETPPVSDELIYAGHERGFALCSMRNPQLSRYYVQCPLDTDLEDWPDERFWEELAARLPDDVAAALVTGPSIEKSIAPLRSFVAEPMRHGRLLLAGDAAHIVPPTGAKGLNLALSDVAIAARALAEHGADGSTRGLAAYSETASRRVWQAVRFSWWMTTTLHRFPDRDDFDRRLQQAELDLLATSQSARANLAESYVGPPLP